MRILVTGASGFVGGRVVELARDRHEVFGVGRRKLDRADYASVDLGRTPVDGLPELPWHPEAIIHCAARATPYASRRDYERDNVAGTRTVVEWARSLGRAGTLPRLVHVSSSSVLYHDGDQLGLTEESPVGPTFANDYARTKAASEQVAHQYGGSVVVARPRAVFGPGDTVLFPRIIAAAKADRLPLLTGRETPAVGDLIYVDNLAEYLLELAVRPELTGTYHLTNAEPVDMQALLVDVLDRLGFPPPRREVGIGTALRAATVLERTWRLLHLPGEPPITRYGVGVLSWSKTFDPDKMLRDLGAPGISIEKGIAEFVDWQKERL